LQARSDADLHLAEARAAEERAALSADIASLVDKVAHAEVNQLVFVLYHCI
jgi:hypothetical protein